MGDTSLSSADLRGLILEEELPDLDIRDATHCPELDQIYTYSFISKDDVWVEQEEDTVNNLLLQEDLLTLPPLPAPHPQPTHTHTSGERCQTLSGTPSISQNPPDCLPIHSHAWPWVWEDEPLPLSPSPTTPFLDILAENFSLPPVENSCDGWSRPEADVAPTAEQFTDAQKPEQRTLFYNHGYKLTPEVIRESEKSNVCEQRFFQQLKASGTELPKEHEKPEDLHVFTGGVSSGRLLKSKTSEHQQEREPVDRFGKGPGSERHGELCSWTTCTQCPVSEKSSEELPPFDEALQVEASFTQIRTRYPAGHGNSRSKRGQESERGQMFTDAGSSSQGVQKVSTRDANEPRRPKNGFMRYSVKHRAELSRRYPNKDNRGISKLLGTRWKKMTPEEKSPYEAEFSRDIHRIRTQHPLWRYAPLRKSALDLTEPMTTRLRPRDKIRSRFQDGNNSEWDWDLPSRPASQADGSTSPLQHSATSWKQCDVCHLWRPLPGHVDAEDFPQTWNCFMNPDPRFNMCGRLPSLPGAPPTECFPLPSFLQPLEPAQLQVSVSGQSVVGSVCVGIPPPPPQPPLFIVCSVPALFTPVSNITHTVLVSQASAAV